MSVQGQKRTRIVKTKCFGSLEVDSEYKFGWLLDW